MIASKTASFNGQEYLFVKKGESKVWELFGEEIERFEYKPGKEYLIKIKRSLNTNGLKTGRYSLISVLSTQIKDSEQIPLFCEGPSHGDDVFEQMRPLKEQKDEVYIVEGDMVLSHDQRVMDLESKSFFTKTKTKYWPNNIVYYTYGSGFTQQTKVTTAIAEWENETSLSFVYGTGNGNYIEFINDTWNHSYVGMKGGKQQLGLKVGYSTAGTAMHEIGHAVGLQHEHCRFDRANKIVVYSANINPDYLYAFDILPNSSNATIGAVDFSSIMMYGSYAYSINDLPTMKTPEGGTWIAQRSYLSELDIDGVCAIYGPPYHHLESNEHIIQDYVSGIEELYESNIIYSIQIYANKQFTQSATLKYARPITVYITHTYYESGTNQIHQDVSSYSITIPAGSSYYSLGSYHNIEHYQMGNPVELDYTILSLSPSSTMYN